MTAFAACLFALAAVASLWIIGATWSRYGAQALALRGQWVACPQTLVICWRGVERAPVPAPAAFKTSRCLVSESRRRPAARLEWPATALAA